MGFFYWEYAVIKNEEGRILKRIRIKKTDKVVNYMDKAYTVRRIGSFYDFKQGILINTCCYYYDIRHTEPYSVSGNKKQLENVIPPDLYDTFLKSEVLLTLNREASGKGNGILGFIQNLSIQQILLFAMMIIVGGYFLFNGSIL